MNKVIQKIIKLYELWIDNVAFGWAIIEEDNVRARVSTNHERFFVEQITRDIDFIINEENRIEMEKKSNTAELVLKLLRV